VIGAEQTARAISSRYQRTRVEAAGRVADAPLHQAERVRELLRAADDFGIVPARALDRVFGVQPGRRAAALPVALRTLGASLVVGGRR